MDKKTIIAIGMCILIFLVWQLFFIEPPKKKALDGGLDGGTVAQSGAGQDKQDTETAKEEKDQPPAERGAEKTASLKTEYYEAIFSSRGANLKNFFLTAYTERTEDGPDKDNKREDLVSTQDERLRPLTLSFQQENTDFDLPAYTEWRLVKESDEQVVFSYSDPENTKTPIITKTYTITEEDYSLDLEVEVSNPGEESIKEQISVGLFAGFSTPKSSGGCSGGAPVAPRSPVCFGNQEFLSLAPPGSCMGCGGAEPPQPGSQFAEKRSVMWSGINEQYFLLATVPLGVDTAVCQLKARHDGVLESSLIYPDQTISPGASVKHNFRVYAGPKRMDLLEKIKGGVGQTDQPSKLEASVDYGMLSPLCLPMLWLLKVFRGVVGNFGIAIIFLTIVVKLLLLPLTHKSMKSMREMSKLKPMMDDLKKKYGADKQRMNQEMMNLYKVHKINPMGGCFPMLLQMPIWIALYRMLYSAVELYQTPFIPGWINDLSFRDPYFIMPVVLGAAMFLQQKLSPTTPDTQQAKMMLYAMPVFFTFIMLYLPSGLVLYIFVNSVLSIAHQLLYNRMDSKPAPTGAKKKMAPTA